MMKAGNAKRYEELGCLVHFELLASRRFLQEEPGIRQKTLTAIMKEEFGLRYSVSFPGSKPGAGDLPLCYFYRCMCYFSSADFPL